jgi:hypothetical protein
VKAFSANSLIDNGRGPEKPSNRRRRANAKPPGPLYIIGCLVVGKVANRLPISGANAPRGSCVDLRPDRIVSAIVALL